jgi:uncharacterized protein YkwD
MGTIKFISILILIAAAFVAGVFLKDNVVEFYNDFNTQIRSFQETDLGQIILEVQKKVSMPSPLNVGGTENQIVLIKSKIIEETNIQRQNNGLPVLKENTLLNGASSAKASDMFKNQYFEHVSPLGIDPGKLVSNHGYEYIVAGENLILGNFSSEKEVVEKWMASPGHRENILNNRYLEIGVAIIKGTYNGETVWIGVQEFGLPLSACSQPDPTLKSQIDFDKEHLDSLSLQLDEKKNQIETANSKSPAYKQMVDDYNQMVQEYNSLAEQVKIEIANYNNQISIFNNCVGEK